MQAAQTFFFTEHFHDLGRTAGCDGHTGHGNADAPHDSTRLASDIFRDFQKGIVERIVIKRRTFGQNRNGAGDDVCGKFECDFVFLVQEKAGVSVTIEEQIFEEERNEEAVNDETAN